MLNVLDLLVDKCSQLLFRGSWHVVACLLEKFFPLLLLLVLLLSQFLVDCHRDLHGLEMSGGLYIVYCPVFTLGVVEDVVCGAGRLIKEEGPLDLVLPLLVSWWSCLVAYVPSVIVDVSGVTATIRRLRLWLREGLIGESLLDHKLLMLVLQVLEVFTDFGGAW